MVGVFSKKKSKFNLRTNIHVLVVAIEDYESESLQNLSGVSKTAWSISHWWNKAEKNGHMLPGRHLASVRTLTCHADSNSVDQRFHAGVSGVLNASEIEHSIVEWATTLGKDSVGILHWIGHGESLGEHGGPLLGLYLPDLDSGNRQILDWENIKRGLSRLPEAPTIWCFIDACRAEPESLQPRRLVQPFATERRESGRSNLNAIYSTTFGGTSHCSTRIEPPIDELDEGPAFSNALLMALDRFAATLRNNLDGPAAYASDIEEATQQRMIEWLTNRNILDWRDYVYGEAEPIIERKPGKNHTTPIVSSPNPHSMLNVKMLRKRTSKDSCKVFLQPNETGVETDVPLRKAPNGWNADLSRRGPQHSTYDVQVRRQRSILSNEGLRREKVHANYPVHSLVLED